MPRNEFDVQLETFEEAAEKAVFVGAVSSAFTPIPEGSAVLQGRKPEPSDVLTYHFFDRRGREVYQWSPSVCAGMAFSPPRRLAEATLGEMRGRSSLRVAKAARKQTACGMSL